jgi:hypothetical protein
MDYSSRFYKDQTLTRVWAKPCPFLLLLQHHQLLACAAGKNQTAGPHFICWGPPAVLVISSCTSQVELKVSQQQQEGTGLCPNFSKYSVLIKVKSGAAVYLSIDYPYETQIHLPLFQNAQSHQETPFDLHLLAPSNWELRKKLGQ